MDLLALVERVVRGRPEAGVVLVEEHVEEVVRVAVVADPAEQAEVVLAALVPAVLYYVCLFAQVDAIAVRFGLQGIPMSELPKARRLIKGGWVFLLPIAVLVYLLFGRAFDPALSALADRAEDE